MPLRYATQDILEGILFSVLFSPIRSRCEATVTDIIWDCRTNLIDYYRCNDDYNDNQRSDSTFFFLETCTSEGFDRDLVKGDIGEHLQIRSVSVNTGKKISLTPAQKVARYHMADSRGSLAKAGRVKRKARRQNAYAMNNTGKNVWKATSRGGGLDCGWENNVTCQ